MIKIWNKHSKLTSYLNARTQNTCPSQVHAYYWILAIYDHLIVDLHMQPITILGFNMYLPVLEGAAFRVLSFGNCRFYQHLQWTIWNQLLLLYVLLNIKVGIINSIFCPNLLFELAIFLGHTDMRYHYRNCTSLSHNKHLKVNLASLKYS